jgi:hypothetical protein
MSDADVGEIVATTLRNRRANVADNVTQHNALLRRLDSKGGIREVAQGGRTIFEPLIYDTNGNSSAAFYTDYDTFTPPSAGTSVIDGAEFSWKQLGGFVAISGLEEVKNAGKFATVDLLEARIKHLQAALRNKAALSLYSDGTGSSSKEFGGLQLLVADTPTTGTVGGINRATFTFWRNQYSASTSTSATTVQGRMNSMWLSCIRGTDKPDLILADNTMFTYYWASLQTLARFTESKSADIGFMSVKYMDADVVYDNQCPTKHMYFLNTDSIAFRYAPNRWFAVGDPRTVVAADYRVIPVWVAGNFTMNNCGLNGVVIAS